MSHAPLEHRFRSSRPLRESSALQALVLVVGFTIAIASGVAAYHRSGPYGESNREDPRVRRVVDAAGRLRVLIYDADSDGRFDTWSYMDGERLLRLEIDEDEDGLIDRWEFFGPDQKIEKIGLSQAHNGRPDTWEYPGEAEPAPVVEPDSTMPPPLPPGLLPGLPIANRNPQ